MKLFQLVLLAVVSCASASASTIKVNLAQVRDLVGYAANDGHLVPGALTLLDGSTHLDKDNTAVQIPYELKGSTRFAISRDIKALAEAEQTIIDAVRGYMKGAALADEAHATPAQEAEITKIAATPIEVTVALFSQEDLLGKGDTDLNPIPPSVLTRLSPLLKP